MVFLFRKAGKVEKKGRESMMINRRSYIFLPVTSVIGMLSILAFSGCFAPRFSSPLEDESLPNKPVAIIPMIPSQVRMVLRMSNLPEKDTFGISAGNNIVKDREEVVTVINEILNSLAEGVNNPLLGPEKLDARVKDPTFWEKVYVYINDPGDINEPWKLRGLSELFKQLGIENIVKITAIVDAAPVSSSGTTGAFGTSWNGKVTIGAELITGPAQNVIYTGRGEAEFWGAIGGIGGFGAGLPVGLGKTFGRAADQALREALRELFKEHPMEKSLK